MRPVPPFLLVLGAAVVVGCSAVTPAAAPSSTPTPAPTTTPGTTTAAPATPAPVELPAVPEPAVAGDCPYLLAADVAQLNGERVGEVRLDPAYDPPACLFTSANTGEEQLRVWVLRAASAEVATAVVDRAAPVDSTDPADLPGGWIGGSTGGPDGAVYAVSKGAVAVVVTTNQEQSVKARRVAELVISSAGL